MKVPYGKSESTCCCMYHEVRNREMPPKKLPEPISNKILIIIDDVYFKPIEFTSRSHQLFNAVQGELHRHRATKVKKKKAHKNKKILNNQYH